MDSHIVAHALVSVLTYRFAMGAGLSGAKIDTVEAGLLAVLRPLHGQERSPLPGPVVDEASTGSRQAALDDLVVGRPSASGATHRFDAREWVDSLSSSISGVYQLSAEDELLVAAKVAEVLQAARQP
ncbi:hypothetical protein JOF53_000019 [Crossiella equi]|uniref:Uncharacterized protein n=1 Tax=Crossiella equi TaxID=130796 RepID=A0ABS5A4E4_9PSEU|nr:hypothetical protein [Crossiella equi]MBP2471147.1 hypothetical protein [Crossiella equi]